jgi:hypothetical protein
MAGYGTSLDVEMNNNEIEIVRAILRKLEMEDK